MKTLTTILLGFICLAAKAQTYLSITVTNNVAVPGYSNGYLSGYSYWATNSFQVPSNSVAMLSAAYGTIFDPTYGPEFSIQCPSTGTNIFYWRGMTPLPGPATVHFVTSGSQSNAMGIVVIRFDRVRTVHPGQRVP